MSQITTSLCLSVKSMYPNITNTEEIKKTVKKSLENYQNRTVRTKIITIFLALIVTLNNLIFNRNS